MGTTNPMLWHSEPVDKTLLTKLQDRHYHIAPNLHGLKIL